jgi:hypothetical protein
MDVSAHLFRFWGHSGVQPELGNELVSTFGLAAVSDRLSAF